MVSAHPFAFAWAMGRLGHGLIAASAKRDAAARLGTVKNTWAHGAFYTLYVANWPMWAISRLLQPLRGFDTVIFAVRPPRAHPAQPMARGG